SLRGAPGGRVLANERFNAGSGAEEDKGKAQSKRHRAAYSAARWRRRPGEFHRYCLAKAGWTRRLGRRTRGIGGCAAVGPWRRNLISFASGDRPARHSDCDLGLAAAIGQPGDREIADGCFGYAALRLASISLRLMRQSAVWIAVRAAPLRRLSDTHHNARPFSTVGSSRMRLTKVASSPAASYGVA